MRACLFGTRSKPLSCSENRKKTLIHVLQDKKLRMQRRTRTRGHGFTCWRVYQSFELRQTKWYGDGNHRRLFPSTKGRGREGGWSICIDANTEIPVQPVCPECKFAERNGSLSSLNAVSFSFSFSFSFLLANAFLVTRMISFRFS